MFHFWYCTIASIFIIIRVNFLLLLVGIELRHALDLTVLRDEELRCLVSKLLQNHVSNVEAHLRVLGLVVEPFVLTLVHLLGQQVAQSLLTLELVALLFAFLLSSKRLRWHVAVSRNWWWRRRRSILGARSSLVPISEAVHGALHDRVHLTARQRLVGHARLLAPRVRQSAHLIRSLKVKCLVERIENGKMMNIAGLLAKVGRITHRLRAAMTSVKSRVRQLAAIEVAR